MTEVYLLERTTPAGFREVVSAHRTAAGALAALDREKARIAAEGLPAYETRWRLAQQASDPEAPLLVTWARLTVFPGEAPEPTGDLAVVRHDVEE